jgi:DUF1680 family protein
MKTKRVALVCVPILLLSVPVRSVPSRSETEKPVLDTMFTSAKDAPKAPIKAYPFSLKQVRLLAGPFKDAMDRDLKYLMSLDNDRMLHCFRVTAGLPSSAQPYGGWEKPTPGREGELRGHSLGHFLSALAFAYGSTGDPAVKAKGDALVAELAKCQAALGPRGYLSAFPEEHFDRVESMRRVWAPYYVIHKILAGLIDWAEYGESSQALSVAEKMASWIKLRTDRSDDMHLQRVLENTEQGGMEEALFNLYSLTGKPEHLTLAQRFEERRDLVPLRNHQDQLTGKHVNSFVPNIIGVARAYEITGDRNKAIIAGYFWKEVTTARTFVTGGTSNHERWGSDPYVFVPEMGTNNNESCCTYNLLKLTRHLFGWDADPAAADYYERALLNGILSTQNPTDGMTMYHQAMLPGLYKGFCTPDDSFWCCTGTGMENHVKYGDSIYFHDADGLYVNLYIASELTWPEKGLEIRQDSKFPEGQGTTLIFTAAKPVELALRIRIPAWVAPGGGVKINGRTLEAWGSPSSYLTLKRVWKTGDRVEVSLPMNVRLERLPDDPNMAAILYGPTVLAGQLGKEGLTPDKIVNQMAPTGDPVPVPELDVKESDPNEWVKPVPGKPLTFQTSGVGKPGDVTLVPFYKIYDERYALYWRVGPKPQPPAGRRGF